MHHRLPLSALLVVASGLISGANPAAANRTFDVLIRGGTVIDGTGAPGFVADVGLIGDTIAAIGRLDGASAPVVVAAEGRIVTPGFIDLHTHLEQGDGLASSDVRRRAAQNYITQGVTTAFVNQDGRQPASLTDQRKKLERLGIGVNVALANGHDTLRRQVMGKDLQRPATAAELDRMRELLRRSLADEGSFGLSLGLEYFSGRHADTTELIALATELPAYNGVYISHLRSQGSAPMWYKPSVDGAAPPPTLEQALDEIIQVAEGTGCTAVATHIKGWGPGYRGQAARTVATINAARARGLRLYADVYPYDSAGSDGDFVALPPWAIGSGRPEGATSGPRDYRPGLRRILAAGDQAEALRRDVEHQVALKGGAENIHVLDYPNPAWVGRTLADLMQTERFGLTDLAVRLQLEGDPAKAGGAKLRAVSMEQRDVDLFVTQPWTAGSTDGWIVLPEEAVGPKKYIGTNRRCFGSFPWRLINYTRDRRLESIEESVRKCTGLPAEILNLRDRGRLAPGCKADIAVIDLARLQDHTTLLEPNEYATGVEHVFVNGVAVIRDAERTLKLPGRVLVPAGAGLGGGS